MLWLRMHDSAGFAYDSDDDHRDQSLILDTVDSEGRWIGSRTQLDVSDKGFWHRYLHIWVVNLPDEAVLVQRYVPQHPRFGGKWWCTSGHVLRGDGSLLSAQHILKHDLGLMLKETEIDFIFSCREQYSGKGEDVKQMIEVYMIPLIYPPEISKMHYDPDKMQKVQYLKLGELESMFRDRPNDFFMPMAEEYGQRLFASLRRAIKMYIKSLPDIDSDEERQKKKGETLIDTFPNPNLQEEPPKLNLVTDPRSLDDVYKQGLWHRAVHVWVLDPSRSAVILQLRAMKKRHFGGRWNCSTKHIESGESSLPTAVRAIGDDLGITAYQQQHFQMIFQAENQVDTGGGCFLKQIVDVYCLTKTIPQLQTLQLAKGEVEAVRWEPIEELERAWEEAAKQPGVADKTYVVPSAPEYSKRLFFILKQKCKKPS